MRAHIVHPLSGLHNITHFIDPRLIVASLVPFCAGAAIAFDQRGSIDIGLAFSGYIVALLATLFASAVADAYAMPAVTLGIVAGPGVVLGSLLMLRGSITAEAFVIAIVLGLLMAATVSRAKGLLFVIAFAVPLVWGVYAGPFRLTVAFCGIPVAMIAADRKSDEIWTLATFALTGVALAAAIAWL